MGEAPLNLKPLEESYEIVGELSVGRRDGARSFMAKRRRDGADVFITVVAAPTGDEGNALSHLAADANLLGRKTHRGLVPVLDGRWLGENAFALVTERVKFPTLEELLTKREEAFDYPRIARILQDVNGVIDWARNQKVVHRAVDPETLYVEPGSDHVQMSFVARPIPLAEMPDAEDDARTIATLAHTMLTRSAAVPERENQSLAELRPGLPEKVIQETDAFLSRERPKDVMLPDVRNYIATIAMAETLKRSEIESAEALRKTVESERLARQAIDARREECEQTVIDQQRRLEHEREKFRKEMASIKRELEHEREELAKERAALAEARMEVEYQRQVQASTFKTPIGSGAAVGGAPAARTGRPVFKLQRSRRWVGVPVAAVMVLLIVAAAVFAIGRGRSSVRENAGSETRVVRSEAGAVTPTAARADTVAVPDSMTAPGLPADLLSGIAARAESAPPMPRRRRQLPMRSLTRDTSLGATAVPDTVIPTIRIDTLLRPRTDSMARRDTIRRDTLARRDTLTTFKR